MIASVWRLLTRQILTNPAQDDTALREACEQARYGSDTEPARRALAGTRGDHARRARYVRVLAASTAGGLGSRADKTTGPVDTEAAWADTWAARNPADPEAQLVRARSLLERAWEVRGGGWASTVRRDQWAEFARLADLADQANDRAMALAPDDPTPWVTRLRTQIARSAPRESVDETWRELTRRDPWHWEGHQLRLTHSCRKWSGSHEQMYGFARSVTATAPTGSPLHVLPIRAAAEWALWEEDRAAPRRTAAEVEEQWRQDPVMQSDLDTALSRWFHQPGARHPDWYDDLNHLAYGLARSGRDADAAPVFAAIGKFMTTTPWGWWGAGPNDVAFVRARARARRAG